MGQPGMSYPKPILCFGLNTPRTSHGHNYNEKLRPRPMSSMWGNYHGETYSYRLPIVYKDIRTKYSTSGQFPDDTHTILEPTQININTYSFIIFLILSKLYSFI